MSWYRMEDELVQDEIYVGTGWNTSWYMNMSWYRMEYKLVQRLNTSVFKKI